MNNNLLTERALRDVFEITSYVTIGNEDLPNEYGIKPPVRSAHHGKQMQTTPLKLGKTIDVYFQKEHPWVSDGDLFVDRQMYKELQPERYKGFLTSDFSKYDEFSNTTRTNQYREQLKMDYKHSKKSLDMLASKMAELEKQLSACYIQFEGPKYLYDIGKPGLSITPMCTKCHHDTYYCQHRAACCFLCTLFRNEEVTGQPRTRSEPQPRRSTTPSRSSHTSPSSRTPSTGGKTSSIQLKPGLTSSTKPMYKPRAKKSPRSRLGRQSLESGLDLARSPDPMSALGPCPYCGCPEGRCTPAGGGGGRYLNECRSCGRIVDERRVEVQEPFVERATDNPLCIVTPDFADKERFRVPLLEDDPFESSGFITAFSTWSLELTPVFTSTTSTGCGYLAELERVLAEHYPSSSGSGSGSGSLNLVDMLRAYFQIVEVSSVLGLERDSSEHAIQMFRDCSCTTYLRNRNVEALATAALVQASREAQEPRTLQEISAAASIPQKEIARHMKLLSDALKLSQPINSNSISVHMPRFCNLLQLNKTTQDLASHIGEVVISKSFCTRRNPISISAAAIYLACQLEDKRKTQTEICKATGLTEVTLRKVYKELCENLDDLLPKGYTPAVPPEKTLSVPVGLRVPVAGPRTSPAVPAVILDAGNESEAGCRSSSARVLPGSNVFMLPSLPFFSSSTEEASKQQQATTDAAPRVKLDVDLNACEDPCPSPQVVEFAGTRRASLHDLNMVPDDDPMDDDDGGGGGGGFRNTAPGPDLNGAPPLAAPAGLSHGSLLKHFPGVWSLGAEQQQQQQH